MMAPARHPREELHELLDGRLGATRRAEVETHLLECAECRTEWTRLTSTSAILRDACPTLALPEDLLKDLRRALDKEEMTRTATTAAPLRVIGRRRAWWAAAWTGVAAAVITAVFFIRSPQPSLPDVISGAHASYTAERPELDLTTSDAAELEQFLDARLPFKTRVFDLGMMGYRLLGGRIDRVDGREAAVFLYATTEGRRVICRMFAGDVTELPVAGARLMHNGIPFSVYHRRGRTVVFWPEGDVLCALDSDLPSQSVIDLAFAKSMKI